MSIFVHLRVESLACSYEKDFHKRAFEISQIVRSMCPRDLITPVERLNNQILVRIHNQKRIVLNPEVKLVPQECILVMSPQKYHREYSLLHLRCQNKESLFLVILGSLPNLSLFAKALGHF